MTKNRATTGIVIVICVLFLASFLPGCISRNNASTGFGEIIRTIPNDEYNLITWANLSQLKNNTELKNLYNQMKSETEYALDSYECSADLFDFGDTNYVATVNGDTLIIIHGNFDFEDIRDKLQDRNHAQSSYQSAGIWIESDYGEAVAISNELLIIGDEEDVKAYLKGTEYEDDSVYKVDRDFKEIIDKLPPAPAMYVEWGGDGYIPLLTGESIGWNNNDQMELIAIEKYGDKALAKNIVEGAQEQLQKRVLEENVTIEFKQSSDLVIYHLIMTVDYFNDLFFES